MNTTKSTSVRREAQAAAPCHRFTLVEMMVVVVIVAIVIGISIPAFQKIGSGSSVRAGTRMVSAQIRLTRQYAISQRRTVALLMPTTVPSGLPTDLRYVAMKPAIVEAAASSDPYDFEFVAWIDGTQWLHVPRGSVIAEVDDEQGIADGKDNWTATPHENLVATVGVAPEDMDDLDETLSGSTKVGVRAIVFSPTGRTLGPAGCDVHVTVAQIMYDPTQSNDWITRNKGDSGTPAACTANQFNIEINQFTGRVKIESIEKY